MFSVKFMTNDCQISFTQSVTEDDDTLQSYKKLSLIWHHRICGNILETVVKGLMDQ